MVNIPHAILCELRNPPNKITRDAKEFYISFNYRDRRIYGGETTAVVVGQMQRFYILMGDHTKALADLSFNDCLNYLHDHKDQYSNISDDLPDRNTTIQEILATPLPWMEKLKLKNK